MKEASPSGISEMVGTSAEPAFATSGDLRIVAWNSAAERVLGPTEREVVGRLCYEVLEATDSAGNSFCGPQCPWLFTLAQNEPVSAVELWIRGAGCPSLLVTASGFAVSNGEASETNLVHHLNPVKKMSDADSGTDPPVKYALTDRESQVLRLLAQGKSTRRMANDLYISPDTVRSHISRINEKLDVHTRLQAVIIAQRQDLV